MNAAMNNPQSVMRFIAPRRINNEETKGTKGFLIFLRFLRFFVVDIYRSFDSRHRVSVHEFSVAEGVLAKRAFSLESEFAIERDSGLVVREDGQFDSGKVQPFVGQIDHRLHQRLSDALALPIVANHHPDFASVIDSRSRRCMQADHAYDLAVNDGDKSILPLSAFGQKFTDRY